MHYIFVIPLFPLSNFPPSTIDFRSLQLLRFNLFLIKHIFSVVFFFFFFFSRIPATNPRFISLTSSICYPPAESPPSTPTEMQFAKIVLALGSLAFASAQDAPAMTTSTIAIIDNSVTRSSPVVVVTATAMPTTTEDAVATATEPEPVTEASFTVLSNTQSELTMA